MTSATTNAIRVGILGMGGYARFHHDAIQRLEEAGTAKLVCACDPNLENFVEQREKWNLVGRGVTLYRNYQTLIRENASHLDVLIIPTPIPLHLEMYSACVEAGIACYLEKPPTLNYHELESMIQADRSAKKKTVVGFNYIAQPARLALKARLLNGEFGKILRGTLVAMWRRPHSYFERNNWSGRLRYDGRIALDSCFGNAMSHFVHNMLFWVGSESLYSWGMVEDVQAELYRANNIETADTFFVAATVNKIPIRFALTHACAVNNHHTEKIFCEHATISYAVGGTVRVDWKDGRSEVISPLPYPVPDENHHDYFRYLRGEDARPATTLEDCRSFVWLNSLAYISSQTIESISGDKLSLQPHDSPDEYCLSVDGIEQIFNQFVNADVWPESHGWYRSAPPRRVTPAALPQIASVVAEMTQAITAGRPEMAA